MIIGFMLVLLIVGMGMTLSMYSQFLPFIQTLGDIRSYNTAYYAALGGVERAQSVIRYREPGFVGSGGRQGTISYGPRSDRTITHPFGFVNQGPNGLSRSIDSRTSTRPASGQSDIPVRLRGSGSEEYMRLDYYKTAIMPLMIDTTSDPEVRYTPVVNLSGSSLSRIDMTLRLPPSIQSGFGGELLCMTCDDDGDRLTDDLVASWKIYGERLGTPWSIVPTSAVFYNEDPAVVDESLDTSIRKSTINQGSGNLTRSDSPSPHNGGYNPIVTNTTHDVSRHNLISSDTGYETRSFQDIFQNPDTNRLWGSISLVSLLKTSLGQVYPFLEMKASFGGAEVADSVYRIQGIGKVGDYQIRILVNKPTSKQSGVGDFTIIF